MKKKAIKIATASAVAASAFVAAAPLQSNAASNVLTTVDNAVKSMQVAYHTYSDVTASGQFADINKVYAAYNKAKADYTAAKALVVKAGGTQKDAYLAKLDSNYKDYISKRVVTYIDAYNYAVTNLEGNQKALQTAIDAKDLAGVQKAYNEISYQLKVRTVILDRVYGQTTRELLRSSFKADAQALRDSMQYDVTVAVKAKAVSDAVTAGKLDVAKAAVDQINKYLPQTTVFKDSLTTTANAAIAAYEATQTPKVESVSAINAAQVEVKFNKAVDSSTIFDANGALVAGVITINSLDNIAAGALTGELSADGKTLTITSDTKLDKRYDVIVDKVKTADKADIAKATVTITVSDTTRPTFVGVSYQPNGNATFTFSEPVDATAAQIATALTVTGPTSVNVGAEDITLSTDKKSFTVALPAAMTKDQNYTFTLTGLKDFAGNLLTPNPVSTTVVKKDVDSVKPTVTSVASAGVGKVAVTFSEQVDASNASLTVGGVAAAGLTTSTNAGKTVVTFKSADLTAGVKSLVIGGVKDLAGNTMDNATRVVEITADTTAPVFVSQSIKTVAGVQYLVLNYNEEVTVDNSKTITGTYVGSDNITKPITALNGTDLSTGADGKSVEVKLPALTGDLTLNLPAGLAKDTATPTANVSAAKTTTFKLGTAVDTTKPVVLNVVQTNNKIVVTFDREVSAASALNSANYGIEGISSPFVGTPIFKGDAKTVELTLRDDVITTSGARNFTVQNIATGAGAVMVTEVKARNFVETVRPTAVSAKVIDATHIEVTFSEAIKDGAVAGTDFEVFQGASTTALGEVKEVIAGNKATIELTTGLSSLSGLTVKAQSTIDVLDLNNNVINFSSVAVQ